MSDIWLLYRARDHPRIGDFDSEEAAQDFADEHALVDWKPLLARLRPVSLFDGQEHKQVCEVCGEDWPCRVERLERKARALTAADRHCCAKCGKRTSWVRIVVPGGGLLSDDAQYCGKLGPCRTFALKELLRLGHVDLHAEAEADRQRRSRDLAERKAQKQRVRDVWKAGLEATAISAIHLNQEHRP